MKMKRVLFWLMIAFIVYAVFTSPTQSADIVRTAWDIIVQGVQSIAAFFDSLLSRS